MDSHKWNRFAAGGISQADLRCGADFAALAELDPKRWMALSMPIDGVRFDRRTLELLDTDRDGRIRASELIAAVRFLQSKDVKLDDLLVPSAADEKRLADVTARQAALEKEPPSAADEAALAAWKAEGEKPEVAVLGDGTASAEAALAAVEPTIDAFFAPPEDMPLVTDVPDVSLPLRDHLNPKHLEAVLAFANACVTPLVGARETLSRLDWKAVKAKFAPYRAWRAAKPVVNANLHAELEEEERVLRYKLHLAEFAENFVNMRRLYDARDLAIFQAGTLRIDAKELHLCLCVASETAHAALAEKSNCCLVYLKLTRPGEAATGAVCAVVTAGRVAGLYVGRNGVFFDRDGKEWEATVTKVVERQVSLVEAFWAPWRKLGETVAETVKKFIGDKQKSATAAFTPAASASPNAAASAGGAALASSVAAIGIGIGMLGTAAAALMAAIKGMQPIHWVIAVCAAILVVSVPSVILTWFKLRKRDLGALLNASGWAVNRPMRFSMRLARTFTICR